MAIACEQAVMTGSTPSVGGASNEKFEEGDSYDGGWM
jgi:hypothetical protein